MKNIVNQIAEYLQKNLELINDKMTAVLYAERLYDLYDHLNREYAFEDDLEETLDKDLETQDLTLYAPLFGGENSPHKYTTDDIWWWYLDESHNGAISIRTGEYLNSAEIERQFKTE